MGKMKIAFYIDPLKSIHSKFYSRVLLRAKMMKLGYTFEIHIPRLQDHAKINSEELSRIPYVHDTHELQRVYRIPIHNEMPSPKVYDALVVIENFNAGAKGDNRVILAEQFQKANKRVICIRDDTIFEYSPVNLKTRHGICSHKLLGKTPKWFLDPKFERFDMPLLSNPKFVKPGAMTREAFCQKYGLDASLKIIAFLPGRCGKWNNLAGKFNGTANPNVAYNLKVSDWFNRNFKVILKELSDRGYQLVSKLHVRDPNKFLENKDNTFLHMNHIKYVDQLDSCELLTYSDLVLTFATTMVYYLYLCDLPTLEIGSGIYYPEWSAKNTTKIVFPIAGYKPKELIFGQQVKIETLTHDGIGKVLDKFVAIDHRRNFKYWKNNPIYGNSYESKPIDIAKMLSRQLR